MQNVNLEAVASLCAILFSRACVLFILVAFCDEKKKEFTIFCGRALVRVRAKIEKTPFLVMLRLEQGQKCKEKHHF